MKNLKLLFIFILILPVCACNPKVSTSLSKRYPALDYREDVLVLGLDQEEPDDAEFIGLVKVGDTGFSTNCGYDVALDKAKNEARKAGGNVIKIIDHKPPSIMGSSCHRITARILRVPNPGKLVDVKEEEHLAAVEYAVLNVYRYGGVGALVGYDLHLGDSVICRVTSNFKTSIQIKKLGRNSLWAKTESKSEIPVNIQAGRVYFVRCGIKMGVLVGRPVIELVDKNTGSSEFNSIKAKTQ